MKIGFPKIAVLAFLLAAGPALAQTTPAGSSSTSSTTTSSSSNSANNSTNTNSNGGLGEAYNFEVPSPSPATCCQGYYDHTNANGNATIVMKNFNQKLAAVQLAIIEAMRLGTGQLSGNMREQTGATHTLADQQDDRSTVKSVETARLEAIHSATSGTTSCRVISGTVGGGTERAANQFRTSFTKALAEHDRGANGSPASKGTAFALQANVTMHCATYADSADVAAGICPSVGKLPGADLNVAESLFYNKNGLSMTLENDRLEAAKAFAVHAITPQPAGQMLPQEASTPQGKEKAALRAAAFARNSVAADTVADFTARRTPNPDNKLTGWAKDMASKMTGFESMDFSNGASKNDWLSVYSRGFLLQGDSLGNSDQSEVTAIKDIKNMMAVSLYQNFENYLLMEKIAMNLAIQTSILVEQSRGLNN